MSLTSSKLVRGLEILLPSMSLSAGYYLQQHGHNLGKSNLVLEVTEIFLQRRNPPKRPQSLPWTH